jgi:hypothetical protein
MSRSVTFPTTKKTVNDMENTKKHDLILEAYDLLSDVTPKKYDCGILCSAACCGENMSHGDEDDCGMLLLPGEKELLSGRRVLIFAMATKGAFLFAAENACAIFAPLPAVFSPFIPR